MEKISYFDYCACALLLLLLFTMKIRKMNRGHLGKRFLTLVLATTAACFADIWSNTLDNVSGTHIIQGYIANTLYFLFHNLMMPLCILYIVSASDTWHILRRNKILLVLLCLPGAVELAAIIINLFVPVIFYFDENGCYTRGNYILLIYAMAAVYLVYGVSYCIRFRESLGMSRYISILSVYVFSVASVVFQYFFPKYQIEIFANAFGLLFISMMVQRPEDTIDSETRLYKLKAYLLEIKTSYRNEKKLEIIQVNITNYKSLREMMGYEVISELAGKVASVLLETDLKNRYDSDIYNLGSGKLRLVAEEKSFAKTETVAEEINEKLKQDIVLKFGSVGVVANVCIVRLPEDISNLESLMAFGDDLNTFPYTGNVIYASDIYKKRYYDIMRDIDKIIERALADKKFEVYYQPIRSISEKRFNSAEALLRLNDAKYGFVSPEIFIPAAEKSGAIHRIGAFVLEEVCRFISGEEFGKLGLDYIEVNLSVAQCMQKNLAENVLKTLKTYNVSPSRINLEITETAVAYSDETLMENLTKLTEAGIKLSLDDFGTGYSNMRRIALLPLKIVKFDRTFSNAENTPNMLLVLKNTIKMIKDMNMEIVVEGIESEDLIQLYSDLKCEYIQGYYYSKPIPKEEFVKFIMDYNRTL